MIEHPLNSGITFALIGFISYGIGDFLVALVSRKIGSASTLFWVMLISALLATGCITFTPSALVATHAAFSLSIISGLLVTIGSFAFIKGLIVGKVSIVSPISAGNSIIIVAAGILIFGEMITNMQLIGISVVIFGTILAATNLNAVFQSKQFNFSDFGIPYALAAFFFWGVGLVIFNQAVARSNWIMPNLIVFSTGTLLAALYLLIKQEKIRLPRGTVLAQLIFAGIGTASGFISYSLGIERAMSSIVAPIVASFPAINILLARIVLKEKLNLNQATGIIAIIFGIVILNI